jgi:ubiquinone/menaquinone biosynthesis C-methylase UbiE
MGTGMTTGTRKDTVWQLSSVSEEFLEGMRGAIPMAAEQLAVMLRVVQAAQPQMRTFLDLGCGDGILAQALLAHYPQAKAVLMDFSEPMIAAARRKLADYPQTVFLTEDYGDSAWVQGLQSVGSLDAVVSGFSIHHQTDARKQAIYREIYHLLKPGGVFVNIEHVAPASEWVENQFDNLFIDSQLAYHQARGSTKTRETVAQEYHERPHKEANILAPLETQCAWLREIGFAHVDSYLKIFELAVFGGVRPMAS